MMKILHTSDWHLGHEFYDYQRQDEFEHLFCQLRQIVAEERPDAFLLSGDVYHSSVPSVATQTMYTEAMLQLHEACPEMAIFVTAGNHDSASRLEIDRSLWHHFRVHVFGGLARNEQGVCFDDHICRVGEKGWIVAVPHVFKQNFPASPAGTDRQQCFFEEILRRVGERNTEHLPVVLMAHLAVTENPDHLSSDDVGGMDYYPLGCLGEGYDYAALGHLHRPHQVPEDNAAVRYSGSPLPITFNEEYEHSVTIAEVRHGEVPQLRVIPLQPLRHVRTIPEVALPFEDALHLLSDLPEEESAYIQLRVASDNGLPLDSNERAVKAVEGKRCRFCTFKIETTVTDEGQRQIIDLTPDQLREMGPLEVAARHLRSKGLPEEDYLELLKVVLKQMDIENAK